MRMNRAAVSATLAQPGTILRYPSLKSEPGAAWRLLAKIGGELPFDRNRPYNFVQSWIRVSAFIHPLRSACAAAHRT